MSVALLPAFSIVVTPAFLSSWGTLGFTTVGSTIAYASLRASAEQGGVIDEVRAGSASVLGADGNVLSFAANEPVIAAGLGLYASGQRVNRSTLLTPTVAQLQNSANVTDAEGFSGFGNSIRIPGTSGVNKFAYAHFAAVGAGTVVSISFLVKSEDGNAPSFPSTVVPSPSNSFAIATAGGSLPTADYWVEHVINDVWRVGTTATTIAASNFGVLQYVHHLRAFRVTAFEIFLGAVPPSRMLVPGSSDAGGATLNASSPSLDSTSWAANVSAYSLQDGFRTDVIAAIDYLTANATRRLWTFGVDEDNCVKLDFTTSNTFVYTMRKSGVDIFTLTSGTISATGDYTVSITSLPGAYAMTVSGGISGDTNASSETLPTLTTPAIARAIGGTATLNGAIRELVVGEAG